MSEQEEISDMKKKVLATGLRVGTNVKTKFMKPFITDASPEGLYMINLDITLERIQTAAKFINQFESKKVIVCSGRKIVTRAIEKFSELTNTTIMVGRFMPGTLTNPSLSYYTEPSLIVISDPQVDQQAIIEATNAGIPVIGVSNTDNITSEIDLVIPANNRGRKAVATIYWLLARQILVERGELKENEEPKFQIEDFETKIIEAEEEIKDQNFKSNY